MKNSKEEEEEGKDRRGRTRKGTSKRKRKKKKRAYETHRNCPVVIKFIKELNNAHLRILLNWL